MINRKPDEIDKYGNKFWYDDNGFDPAVIWNDGSKFWYKHGELHNDFGPAVIYWDGFEEWYIDGEEYTEEEEFKQHKIKCFICNS